MTRKMMYAVLQCLTYGMLIGLSFEEPLIGENVRDAQADEFPFVISIAWRPPKSSESSEYQNRNFCTGTLISSKSVLTASHCFTRQKKNIWPGNVEIIAGHADVRLGEKYYPKSWTTYEMWKNQPENPKSLDDIAIITLQGSGIRNSIIEPASLMLDPTNLKESKVIVAGWGKSEDGQKPFILKTAELTVISNEKCSSKATQLIGKLFVVPIKFFCSVADPWIVTTNGDSGAPTLNEGNQVVGISVGLCPPLEGYPPAFQNENYMNTRLYLYKYRDFIDNVTVISAC